MRGLDTLNFEGMNQISLASAECLLLELTKFDIKPGRIVRTAEAVISMWFKVEAAKFRIECCEDGEFALSIIKDESTHTEFKAASTAVKELAAEMMNENRDA